MSSPPALEILDDKLTRRPARTDVKAGDFRDAPLGDDNNFRTTGRRGIIIGWLDSQHQMEHFHVAFICVDVEMKLFQCVVNAIACNRE